MARETPDSRGQRAREGWRQRPFLWQEWAVALAREGRWAEVPPALEEAAANIGDPWLCCRFCDAVLPHLDPSQPGGAAAATAVHRLAWRQQPGLRRLGALLASAGPAWEASAREELERGYLGQSGARQAHLIRLELLLGDDETALARLEGAETKGCWRHEHPAQVVVPWLLWAGVRAEQWSEDGVLPRVIDRAGGALDAGAQAAGGDAGWRAWLEHRRGTLPRWQADAPVYLARGIRQVEAMLGALSGSGASVHYPHAAELTVAGVQALSLARGVPEARSWWQGVRRSVGRRRALARALDALVPESLGG